MRKMLFFQVTLAFLLATSVACGLFYFTETRWEMEKKKRAMLLGARQAATFERVLFQTLSATTVIASFLQQGNGRIEDFPVLAAQMARSRPAASNYQLAPNGIIREIFPLKGNEKAIGHDLLADTQRDKEARRAIKKKKLTLAGPFELIQGGIAVIGREPVFLEEQGQERFWGFASVLIQLKDLLRASALDRIGIEGYAYSLWRIHPDTGQRHEFGGSGETDFTDAVDFNIRVPNAQWKLSIIPTGGWAHSPWYLLQIVLSSLGVLFFTYSIYYLLKQPIILHDRVEERTRELSEKNEALESEMRLREQVELELTCAQVELAKHSEMLELLVEERTRELEEKNDELLDALDELKTSQSMLLQREKMATIGQLAAGVAHEINNPIGFVTSNLNSLEKYRGRILSFMDLQSRALEDLSPEASGEIQRQRKDMKIDYILEDSAELIEESLDGTERVSKIVQGLKTFSRLDEAENKPADLNKCLDDTINIAWNEIKYQATLNREFGEIPEICCNSHQLNQVFMNMLVNAAQSIQVQGEIVVKTWTDSQQVFVRISDTGCGIPEENLSRIFEPFFTTKEVGEGTGLGMSIAYDIVKKHGGEIQVESSEHRGTAFTINLPILTEG